VTCDACYFVWTSAASGTTLNSFTYRDNTFRRIGYTSGYAPFEFYSTGSPATFNEVHIENNTTNQTFGGSGFVHFASNIAGTGYSERGNWPVTNVTGNGQFGFANVDRLYEGYVTDRLAVGDGYPDAATGTPAYIDLGASFSNVHGSNLKLRLYSGGSVYGLGISAGQLDYVAPDAGSDHAFWVNGANVFNILGDSVQFKGTNTTGVGAASLGSNSPALTTAAPYTWIKIKTADGSTAYIPAWK
jgi:hypothetical protein